MNRSLALLDHAIGALVRRRGRNTAIASGLAVTVLALTSVGWLASSLRAEYERGLAGTPDVTVQRLEGGRPALIDGSALAPLRDRPGVLGVEPRVWGYVYMPSLEANLVIVGRGARTVRARVLDGRLPTREAEMALGRPLANALGLRLGDRMALPTPGGFRLMKLVGLFRADTALRTSDVLLTTDADARILLGLPEDRYVDVAIHLSTPDESHPVAQAALALVPGGRVLERELLRRTYALTYDARAGLLSALFVPALLCFLLLAWERLTGLGEGERLEIGILKSVGWDTGDVLAVRMWESALVSLAGTAVGLVGAYVYVFVLGAPGLSGALFGWSRLVPPLELAPAIDPIELLSLALGVIVPFVALSVVPAWRAAMRDPDEILRGGL
ncbi:MAG: FtsX-like permease family protein [Polyangiales bacterium]